MPQKSNPVKSTATLWYSSSDVLRWWKLAMFVIFMPKTSMTRQKVMARHIWRAGIDNTPLQKVVFPTACLQECWPGGVHTSLSWSPCRPIHQGQLCCAGCMQVLFLLGWCPGVGAYTHSLVMECCSRSWLSWCQWRLPRAYLLSRWWAVWQLWVWRLAWVCCQGNLFNCRLLSSGCNSVPSFGGKNTDYTAVSGLFVGGDLQFLYEEAHFHAL